MQVLMQDDTGANAGGLFVPKRDDKHVFIAPAPKTSLLGKKK
jgi:hypothetical protein